MGHVFEARGRPYEPKPGETLAQIAEKECEPGVGWRELALFNWGTDKPEEVNRALIEIVGCSLIKEDPSQSVLDPKLGILGRLLIPKIFKCSGLSTDQTHTITIRKRLPAPAISITKLDKWFIPGQETCDIEYSLEGIKERADKVDFEVYASHYASATSIADGEFLTYSWTELDTPIRSRTFASEQRPGFTYRITGWKGESEAGKGALQPRKGATRYINVAFSPYTVLLRYYKNPSDRKARLRLDPFWVEFSPAAQGQTPQPKPESLRIGWEVVECAKLKYGQLIIWDKDDQPVFRKPLGAARLTPGKHEWDWTDGMNIARADRMPYRVQIQAHTDIDEDNGLALAAMHTEVRLWCHADTGRDPANYWNDPVSLILGVAPYLPPPEPSRKSVRFAKLRLAEAGFHPGPVDEDAARADFQIALKEFQRSWPRKKLMSGFKRLVAQGNLDQHTRSQLRKVPADYRPLFGDPDRRNDLSRREAARRLADPHARLIVWVDDRHCYTQGGVPPHDPMAMGNYRGAMDIGDQRMQKDRESIARPWIPIEVALPLLSKKDPLDVRGSPPRVTEAMRRAIGPIRVDWTFREPPQDHSVIASIDRTLYRPRRWVQEIVTDNCPEDRGGIRPAALADYYRAAFGFGNQESLLPWRAWDDAGAQTICSVVHDDLGQDVKNLHKDYVGKAGVYFRPSRIAGDGYVLCAQVSFRPLPEGGDFPNRAVLEKRYPRRPLARSASLRIWRKTSFRGYVEWLPQSAPGWQDMMNQTAARYQGAFLHFVHEDNAPRKFVVGDLITAKEFVQLIKRILDQPGSIFEGLEPRYTQGYVWPYCHLPSYGIDSRAESLNQFVEWLASGFLDAGWRLYREELLHLLLRKVETRYGRLRGHLLVEFEASPQLLIVEYTCDVCGRQVTEIANDPTVPVKPTTGIPVTSSFNGTPCFQQNCPGHFRVSDSRLSALPLPAVGASLGACWLFQPREVAVWAHEIGHHRNLEHAPAYAGSTDEAPGAKPDQHDAAQNPHAPQNLQWHQMNWARFCIMSYDREKDQHFCGKCLLRNRGWTVEDIADPAGNLEDP
jgi:hypothetical protein